MRKRKRAKDTAIGPSQEWGGEMYGGSVLARKGGGLPETGLNDGGTAELSGLKTI